jgi:hypothetical protein
MREVEDLLTHIKQNHLEINELIERKEFLQHKINTDDHLDDVSNGLEKELHGVALKLKWASDDRDTLFSQMQEAAEMMKMKEDYIGDQEA